MVTLTVGADERVTFAGKTGSGKTVMAQYLARDLDRLLVLDPKSNLTKPEWKLEDWNPKTTRTFERKGKGRLRYPTPLDGNWKPALQWAWDNAPITIYIDEVYGVIPPNKRDAELVNIVTAMYTRGRELGIGMWAATQRPAWIPLFLLSESEWFFIFRLQLETDRRRVAEFAGPIVLTKPADDYGFFLFNAQWDDPIYSPGLKLK